MSGNAPGSTCYVGNVAANVDEATIHALFSHCGTVTTVRIAGCVARVYPRPPFEALCAARREITAKKSPTEPDQRLPLSLLDAEEEAGLLR